MLTYRKRYVERYEGFDVYDILKFHLVTFFSPISSLQLVATDVIKAVPYCTGKKYKADLLNISILG